MDLGILRVGYQTYGSWSQWFIWIIYSIVIVILELAQAIIVMPVALELHQQLY